MYGIFDELYHEPWSKHIATNYMLEAGICYSIEPQGREKGWFDKVVKIARTAVLKTMNRQSKKSMDIHC